MNKKLYLTSLLAFALGAGSFAQTRTVLSNCDDLDGWNPGNLLTLDNLDKKEGSASLSNAGAAGVMDRFVRDYATPINTGVTEENGYLSFWLYISDASKIQGHDGQIEIKSADNDEDEYNWHIGPMAADGRFQSGWNKVILSLKSANKGSGSPNLQSITRFKIYFPSSEQITTKIDDVVIYSVSPGTLVNADTKDGWRNYNQLSLDFNDFKEGEAALSISGTDTERFVWSSDNGVNSTVTKSNGYLSFWFYVDNVSKLTVPGDSQIEISSSGEADNQELNWNAKDQFIKNNVKAGWNKIILKLSEGNASGGDIDLTRIKFFRLYTVLNESITTKIDGLEFYKSEPNGFDTEVLSEWDNHRNFMSVDYDDFKEGKASLVNNGTHENLRFEKRLGTPFDSGVTEDNGYLAFWFYVDDVTKYNSNDLGVGSGQVEISSGGGNDQQEINWPGSQLFENLQNGWNPVVLKLKNSEGIVNRGIGDPINLNAINYFRIYFGTTSTMVTKIDGIRFTKDPTVLPVKLISFNATQKLNGVALNWATASETNNSRFEVLRSTNGIDYTNVATVVANGTASSYSALDNNPVADKSYYKLIQIDNDGTVSELGIKVVNSKLAGSAFLAYPTYVSDKINIKLGGYSGKSVKAILTNTAGKQVFSRQINTAQDQDNYVLEVGQLGLTGIHFLIIQGENYNKHSKLIF